MGLEFLDGFGVSGKVWSIWMGLGCSGGDGASVYMVRSRAFSICTYGEKEP